MAPEAIVARRRAWVQMWDRFAAGVLECRMSRLVCPRISPEWELAAQLALVKPKPYTKDKIAHRAPEQHWARNARKIIVECLESWGAPGPGVRRPGDKSPGLAIAVEFPKSGEHRMIADLGEMEPARAKRLARKLSRSLPDLWFTFDDAMYFRDGVVYQRTGRYNLELVRAGRTRLRRAVRFGFLQEVDDAVARPDHRARQDQAAQRDR
ncbi:MAG: hypothetical protein QOE14_639 [Humisphaera sp.]|nr:hypothetical protein [Humisphaera sp.]